MRKDLIIAVLLTFCLAATLFMVAATKSQEYDPWADLNGDGKINILDVTGMTSIYGMSGDATRNVTIAKRVNKLAYTLVFPVNPGVGVRTPWIAVDGYSKVTICIFFQAVDNYCYLHTRHDENGTEFLVDDQSDIVNYYVKTYDVPNREIEVNVHNYDALVRTVSIDVYLIP